MPKAIREARDQTPHPDPCEALARQGRPHGFIPHEYDFDLPEHLRRRQQTAPAPPPNHN